MSDAPGHPDFGGSSVVGIYRGWATEWKDARHLRPADRPAVLHLPDERRNTAEIFARRPVNIPDQEAQDKEAVEAGTLALPGLVITFRSSRTAACH